MFLKHIICVIHYCYCFVHSDWEVLHLHLDIKENKDYIVVNIIFEEKQIKFSFIVVL